MRGGPGHSEEHREETSGVIFEQSKCLWDLLQEHKEQKEGSREGLTSWHPECFQAKSNMFAVPTLQNTIKGINRGKKRD